MDVVILNWLPQSEPFVFNRGGYQTINFLPSLATMIFGLMAGELLRSPLSPGRKLLILTGAGVAGIVAGELLGVTGVCPLVKRIWTPSWAIYSTGWCCLILAGLYAVIDVVRFRRWALPLVVVGVNSIAIYCMSMLLKRWAAATWQTHFGADIFTRMPEYLSAAWFWLTDWAAFERLRDDGTLGYWGHLWAPTWEAVLVGVLFWLACLWMYRQKIFVRI